MNPEQMRAFADIEPTDDDALLSPREWIGGARAYLRAAADQLEAVHGMLQAADPGNPYIYDPWSDESVDPTNMDEVVHAAVSAGWSKGAYELAKSIREALEGGRS